MTTAESVVIGAGGTAIFSFGPYRKGDVLESITPVIATPSGGFTIEVNAFTSQQEAAAFNGGTRITRSACTFPSGLSGIDGALPIEYRFTETFQWLGVRIVADGAGLGASFWPKIKRAKV